MKTTTALLLTATATLAINVNAHGGMIDPAPRGLTTMKLNIDSTFGHPITMRASYTNGKGGNCLDFTPDTNLKTLPTGKTTIKMRANDGANHVGMCTAYLVSPNDKTKKIKVGQMNDCMRSLHPGPGNKGDAPIPAQMTIDVPATGLPCDATGHCVLEWYWEASHIMPHELYNNCADVKVSGSSSGGEAPAPAPAPGPTPGPAPTTTEAPKPTTTKPKPTTSTPPPKPKPTQTKTTTPSTTPEPAQGDNGKYEYIGSHPNKAALTQWCNWNCPGFCPTDMCKLAQ